MAIGMMMGKMREKVIASRWLRKEDNHGNDMRWRSGEVVMMVAMGKGWWLRSAVLRWGVAIMEKLIGGDGHFGTSMELWQWRIGSSCE